MILLDALKYVEPGSGFSVGALIGTAVLILIVYIASKDEGKPYK